MNLKILSTIVRKELAGFFCSPIAYAVIALFLILSALYGFMPGEFFRSDDASMTVFFDAHRWVYLILIPALGMQMWSDERRGGTLELLFTLPVRTYEYVIGKFIAAWLVVFIAQVLTFPLIITLFYLGEPDVGKLVCGYAGTLLLAGAYLGIASFASTLSKNQMISFIYGAAGCLFFNIVGLESFSASLENTPLQSLGTVLSDLGVNRYYYSILRGVIDSRDIVYFVLIAATGLALTLYVLTLRRNGSLVDIAHAFSHATPKGKCTLLIKFVLLPPVLLWAFGALFLYSSTHAWRADLSSRKSYSLSNASERLLRNVQTPLYIRFYVTPKAFAKWPGMSHFASRIEDVLNEYARINPDYLKVEKIEVTPQSPEEESARADGVNVRYIEGAGQVWFDIVCAGNGQKINSPTLSPLLETQLENEITSTLCALANTSQEKKTKVALYSDLPVGGDPSKNNAMPPWRTILQLGRHTDLTLVNGPLDYIDSKYDVFVIIHPCEWDTLAAYAVDQYVLNGGKLLVFTDPASYYAFRAPKELPVDFEYGEKIASELEKNLNAWGISVKPERIAADINLAWKGGNAGDLPDPMTLEPTVEQKALNKECIVTSELQKLLMRFCGVVATSGKEGITYTPLITTTLQSRVEPTRNIAYANEIYTRFLPDTAQRPLAVLAEGVFTSSFDAPPPGARTEQPFLRQAKGEGKIIVCGDADMLFDPFAFRSVPDPLEPEHKLFVAQNDNAAFFLNAVDYLAGNYDAIALRRGRDSRAPMRYFTDMQTQLRQRVMKSENDLINEFRTIEQQRQALRAKGATQREMAAVQSRYDTLIEKLKDIDVFNHQLTAMHTRILLLDTFAVPALLLIFGFGVIISLAIIRRAR